MVETSAASSSGVGGFVGNMDNGSITSSRAAGSVVGFGSVGGFVGYMNNAGTISQSYTTGAVTQVSTSSIGRTPGVGGFAGYLCGNSTGPISESYSIRPVDLLPTFGHLILFSAALTCYKASSSR